METHCRTTHTKDNNSRRIGAKYQKRKLKITTDKEITISVTSVDESRLKDVVKIAVLEVFEERRDWLADLLSEVVLDIGLGYAIQEGEQTPTVSRAEVFQALKAG